MGFGKAFPRLSCPIGVLIFWQQRAGPESKCVLQDANLWTAPSGGGRLLEDIHIDAQSASRAKPYDILIKRDGVCADHASDAMQDLMKIVGRGLWVGVWPQVFDDDVAVQPMPRRESEQLDQGFGFAEPPMIFDEVPSNSDGETAQQTDMNVCYRRGLSHRRIFPRPAEECEGFVAKSRADVESIKRSAVRVMPGVSGKSRTAALISRMTARSEETFPREGLLPMLAIPLREGSGPHPVRRHRTTRLRRRHHHDA